MRFQTTETVQTPDSEIVLRALETTLPEISSEVVREGHRITLRGLGPSPRTRNPRDITVLEISSDPEATVIHADVSFQASALLGAISQDSVVRSKLDYVFDQVRSQLSLEARRAPASELVPHSAVFAPAIVPYAEEPHFHTAAEPADQESVRQEFTGQELDDDRTARPAEPPVVTVFPQDESASVEPIAERVEALISEEVVAAPESIGPTAAAESAPVDLPAEVELVEPLAVVEKVAAVPVSPVEADVTAHATLAESAKPRPEPPVPQFSGSQKVQRTHVPALIAAIVALLLLFAVAAYYLLRPNPPDPAPTSLPAQAQPVKGSVFPTSQFPAGFYQMASSQAPSRFFRPV